MVWNPTPKNETKPCCYSAITCSHVTYFRFRWVRDAHALTNRTVYTIMFRSWQHDKQSNTNTSGPLCLGRNSRYHGRTAIACWGRGHHNVGSLWVVVGFNAWNCSSSERYRELECFFCSCCVMLISYISTGQIFWTRCRFEFFWCLYVCSRSFVFDISFVCMCVVSLILFVKLLSRCWLSRLTSNTSHSWFGSFEEADPRDRFLKKLGL